MYSSVHLECSNCLQLQRLLNTYTVAPDNFAQFCTLLSPWFKKWFSIFVRDCILASPGWVWNVEVKDQTKEACSILRIWKVTDVFTRKVKHSFSD